MTEHAGQNGPESRETGLRHVVRRAMRRMRPRDRRQQALTQVIAHLRGELAASQDRLANLQARNDQLRAQRDRARSDRETLRRRFDPVVPLEARLWSGHEAEALRQLDILASGRVLAARRVAAAAADARLAWLFQAGEWAAALREVRRVRRLNLPQLAATDLSLVEAICLRGLGEAGAADRVLEHARRTAHQDTRVTALLSAGDDSEPAPVPKGERLEQSNVLEDTTLVLRDVTHPLPTGWLRPQSVLPSIVFVYPTGSAPDRTLHALEQELEGVGCHVRSVGSLHEAVASCEGSVVIHTCCDRRLAPMTIECLRRHVIDEEEKPGWIVPRSWPVVETGTVDHSRIRLPELSPPDTMTWATTVGAARERFATAGDDARARPSQVLAPGSGAFAMVRTSPAGRFAGIAAGVGSDAEITSSGPPLPRSIRLAVVCDWNLRGGAFQSAWNLALAASAHFGVALIHYPRFQGIVDEPDLGGWLQGRSGMTLFPPRTDLALTVDDVVIAYPPILEHAYSRLPAVRGRRVRVLINQLPFRDVRQEDEAYDIRTVVERARAFAAPDAPVEWVPISGLVRRHWYEDPARPELSAETWHPLVHPAMIVRQPTLPVGFGERPPIVGRHARDHWLKWPATDSDLYDAYLGDRPCHVRLLGGARAAEARLGTLPRNWEVRAFGTLPVGEFLGSLDVFIHFPHDDYIEEFGRAVAEAIAAGVPAILPPRFEETFGDAASYCHPPQVWSLVQDLWSDADSYLDRVTQGLAFINDTCTFRRIAERFDLSGAGTPPDARGV